MESFSMRIAGYPRRVLGISGRAQKIGSMKFWAPSKSFTSMVNIRYVVESVIWNQRLYKSTSLPRRPEAILW